MKLNEIKQSRKKPSVLNTILLNKILWDSIWLHINLSAKPHIIKYHDPLYNILYHGTQHFRSDSIRQLHLDTLNEAIRN